MSTHKHFDKICCVVLAVTLVLTILFMNAERLGVQRASTVMGYESKLFDTSKVHTVNIIMDNWDEFTANCQSEEYYNCTVVIDNDAYKNVAIRGKGNTSLTQVASYGNDRYSFKIEFDHYDSTNTYYGLDKLCLNNIIQDNTYMKDYICYQMMREMGVASPLCSYVYITVNGEDWGLYLAVEGVEESFLQRNYGNDYGMLYKPDSQSMGGGRGNGKGFDIDDFMDDFNSENLENSVDSQTFPQNPNDITEDSDIDNQMSENIPNNDENVQIPDVDNQNIMPGGNIQSGQMPEGMTPHDRDDNTDFGNDSNNNFSQDGMMPSTNDDDTVAPDVNVERDFGQNEMISGDKPDNAVGDMMNGSDDVLLKYIDDDFESYSNIFENAKTNISDVDKMRLIESLKRLSAGEDLADTVDIEAVIRYFVVHNFVLNFDSYTGSMIHNYYLYEKDGQMQMIPWDYNLAFGGFESAGGATNLVNYPIDSPVSGGNTEDRPMIAWIFENEEYTDLYHQYFAEFISEYFESGYFEEMIDSVFDMISAYVEKDPTKFCTYEDFETGVSTLTKFCLLRAESISGQLNGQIGSTSDTQENSTLIDAGDIQISDMGLMNSQMGGETNIPNWDTQLPQSGIGSAEVPELPNGNSEDDKDMTAPFSFEPSSGKMQEPSEAFGDNDDDVSADDSDGIPQFPANMNGQRQNPDENSILGDMEKADQPEQTTNTFSSWVYLGISIGVLAIGIVSASIYRRRK